VYESRSDVPGELDVRLVPISAEQMKVLESLERALRGLADDFYRDIGAADDESIAGGLYRLWSTLEAIRAMWHAAGNALSPTELSLGK
jgi:hypothetical protein